MQAGVKLESIANLLNKQYFIRSYQRGYRWESAEVNDLLNDFYSFIRQDNKEEDEFYCLQPFVIKALDRNDYMQQFSTEQPVFEVIDGQQRLTTIVILLNYLLDHLASKISLSLPTIVYEVRPKSGAILSDFTAFMHAADVTLDENIDFYHMKIVYETISRWFVGKEDHHMSFLKLLTSFKKNNVRVIWYEVDPTENSIAVFRRFNIGKIPLNNAELIKALFFRKNEVELESVRFSISKEWQAIENQFQDKFFWGFLKPEKDLDARIEYLFNLLYTLDIQKKTTSAVFNSADKLAVFHYFSAELKENSIQVMWDRVMGVYEQLLQWYQNPELYHYIGYIKNRKQHSPNKDFIIELLSYKNPENDTYFQTKDEQVAYVVKAIKQSSRALFEKDQIKLNYSSDKGLLNNLFLLHNIETYVKLALASKGENSYQFPFTHFNDLNFDVEHIHSVTDQTIDKCEVDQLTDLLKNLEIDFGSLAGEAFYTNLNQVFKDSKLSDKWITENLKDKEMLLSISKKLMQLLEGSLGDDQVEDKNSIGNLTLLNSSVNRSYGNAFFKTKRRIIIEKDKEGLFIPLVTKNVFLKYYSKSSKKHSQWYQTDADNYKQEITDSLSKFM